MHRRGRTLVALTPGLPRRHAPVLRGNISANALRRSRLATTNLLGPPETAAVAEIALAAGPAPPFGGHAGVAVGAVFFEVAHALSSLTLLLSAEECLEVFGEESVLSLHLSELELPARAACCFEFVEYVVF